MTISISRESAQAQFVAVVEAALQQAGFPPAQYVATPYPACVQVGYGLRWLEDGYTLSVGCALPSNSKMSRQEELAARKEFLTAAAAALVAIFGPHGAGLAGRGSTLCAYATMR